MRRRRMTRSQAPRMRIFWTKLGVHDEIIILFFTTTHNMYFFRNELVCMVRWKGSSMPVHYRTLTDIDLRSRSFLHACALHRLSLHTTYLDRKSEFTLPTQVVLEFFFSAIISVVHIVHNQGTQGTTFGGNKGRLRWRNILLGEVANNGVNKLARGIAFVASWTPTNPALGEGANMSV